MGRFGFQLRLQAHSFARSTRSLGIVSKRGSTWVDTLRCRLGPCKWVPMNVARGEARAIRYRLQNRSSVFCSLGRTQPADGILPEAERGAPATRPPEGRGPGAPSRRVRHDHSRGRRSGIRSLRRQCRRPDAAPGCRRSRPSPARRSIRPRRSHRRPASVAELCGGHGSSLAWRSLFSTSAIHPSARSRSSTYPGSSICSTAIRSCFLASSSREGALGPLYSCPSRVELSFAVIICPHGGRGLVPAVLSNGDPCVPRCSCRGHNKGM